MKIHFVLGPVCSGKSTLINKLFPVEQNVVVRIGKFLRESIGLQAMSQDPKPNVCDVTESWVRWHVKGAVMCANKLGRDVVFDGYPRSVGQVEFFHGMLRPMQSGHFTKTKWPICIHRLRTPIETIRERIIHRSNGSEESQAFDRLRLESSLESVDRVVDYAIGKFKERVEVLEVK